MELLAADRKCLAVPVRMAAFDDQARLDSGCSSVDRKTWWMLQTWLCGSPDQVSGVICVPAALNDFLVVSGSYQERTSFAQCSRDCFEQQISLWRKIRPDDQPSKDIAGSN